MQANIINEHRIILKNPFIFIFHLGILMLISGCAPVLYISSFPDPFGEFSIILRVVFAIVGFLMMVAGFAIFELLISLTGFLIGGVLGAMLGGFVSDGNLIIEILGFVIIGFIGAALALFLVYVGIFISGLLLGGAFLSGIWLSMTGTTPPGLIIIVGAILGGIGMIILYKFWIIALTSAIGAAMFGLAIGADPAWWLIFFLGGMAIQYGLARVAGREEATQIGYRTPSNGTQEIGQPAVEKDKAEDQSARISQDQPAQDISTPVVPVISAYFIDSDGEKILIKDKTLIGRGTKCDYRIKDPKVSRAHALIRYGEGMWFIQDQGSTLGTYVNGQRIPATRLKSGYQIKLGDTTLIFQEGDG